MNWFKELIDSFYFKRALKRDKIGLGDVDIEWLKDHSGRIKRISETMKAYILNETFNSLTIRDHQRRKDWFDCLTAVQKLCETTNKKDEINWLTMKPKKKDN